MNTVSGKGGAGFQGALRHCLAMEAREHEP
jgi:hypothetical protein